MGINCVPPDIKNTISSIISAYTVKALALILHVDTVIGIPIRTKTVYVCPFYEN